MRAWGETVYIIDDDEAVRKALSMLCRSVGLAVQPFSDPRQFLDAGEPKESGCILLDIRMPFISGLQLQEILRDRGCDVPVIFISAHADVPVAVRAMKSGAADLVEKPFSEPALLETVRRVLDEYGALRKRRAEEAGTNGRLERLTDRELEVAKLVADGRSSKEIATELQISSRTVEVHRCRAVRKAGARNSAELVQWLAKSVVHG
ncbi:MAG: response regulator, partial [Planctomycetota bacterium]